MDNNWQVICLCAAWCDTCTDYQKIFKKIAKQYQHIHFVWLDVEDDASFLGDLDIENFPTLLFLKNETPCFFGPVKPYAGVLQDMIKHMAEQDEVYKMNGEKLKLPITELLQALKEK